MRAVSDTSVFIFLSAGCGRGMRGDGAHIDVRAISALSEEIGADRRSQAAPSLYSELLV
jgi:hypothetical protein